jgi:hypothetical protein
VNTAIYEFGPGCLQLRPFEPADDYTCAFTAERKGSGTPNPRATTGEQNHHLLESLGH